MALPAIFVRMVQTRHTALPTLITSVAQGLHPEQTIRRPILFILEITAALLSVLAVHDGISGRTLVLPETCLAVGLWGALVAVVSVLTVRVFSASRAGSR